MWTNESEIRRLWPHRQGQSYIRNLIRINVREIRARAAQTA